MSVGSSVKRNVLASWGLHGFNLVIGFFLTRYTLDVLGVSTYGNWLFINSIAGYASLLYCGFGETVSRFVAKYQSDGDQLSMNKVVSLAEVVFVGLGALSFLIACGMAATAHWWGGWVGDNLTQARIACLILGLNVAISMAGTPFGGVLHGLRRFDLERGIGFVTDVLRLVLFFVLLKAEWGLVIIAAIFFLVTLCENLTYVVFAYWLEPKLEVQWKHVERQMLDECGEFSAMSFINTLASQIVNATDTIVIGFMLGEEAIVPYYFGLRLAQFCRQPVDKIAHICLPTAGAMHSEADRFKRLRFLLRTLGYVNLLITGLFIGAWYFGHDVLQLWVGPKLTAENLHQSNRILLILLGAYLIAQPCNILRAFLFAVGNVKIPALIYIIEAAINLTASVLLCRAYGIEGVAWGRMLSVVLIELLVLIPYALKHLGVPWSRLLSEAIWPPVIPLLSLWAYAGIISGQSWSHDNIPGLMLVSLAGGAILGGVWWLTRVQWPRMFLSTTTTHSA